MSRNRYFNPKKRDNFFDKILVDVPSTNSFDLSFDNKLSFNMGELVPIMCQEVLPGDKFNITTEHLIKLAPLVTPVFHKVKVQTHYFFVPNRLLWDNFEKFQAYDTLNELPIHPFISVRSSNNGSVNSGSLADYLGVPVGDYSSVLSGGNHPIENINALPFAAYYKIYDDYFRDQNLVDEKFNKLIDGDNEANEMFSNGRPFENGSLLKRAWERDYFTSCLPFAQKGQEVVMPLGQTADVNFKGQDQGETVLWSDADITTGTPQQLNFDAEGSGGNQGDMVVQSGGTKKISVDNSSQLEVDLANATSASVNSLRLAVRLQEFFERNARLGTRYIEQTLGKFGVRIRDERAHRSEYIGGTTSPVIFSELLQTSQTDTTPLGQQAGQGQSVNSQFGASHYCEEHGWLIGIMSVLPETGYQQGLHRKFMKRDILDYYDPKFANLGEQSVLNSEIYALQSTSNALGTFGYQSRYAELKYNSSEVHGEFQDTLADWHMSRIFNTPPSLNEHFVQSNPTHRIFADTDEENQKVYAYVHQRIASQRKIPYFSTPTFASNL